MTVTISETLKSLKVNFCELDDARMRILQKGLAQNHSLVEFECENNPTSNRVYTSGITEVQVNNILVEIKIDPQSINATELYPVMQSALANKLKFLPDETLTALHLNESFNTNNTLIKESLHSLKAPSRKVHSKCLTFFKICYFTILLFLFYRN